MPIPKPPYPAEFRRQMVELVQAGRTPTQLAREFDRSAQSISTWVAQAAADGAPPQHTFVVHGEADAAETLRLRIQDEPGWRVSVPEHGATIDA
jgi:transposase